ncbi:acetylcholine receptor subunit beta-like 1 [Portunus trituberculatus]|uniref:acetylcholine receptor subunit beta-like 1 n=1 Tax=Portunus trituberculatus TaxID=210409 RepID=UPI001E1CC920|nr:acetylcholine receptor subunit beta-like 1 [Portunus trituberculatus]
MMTMMAGQLAVLCTCLLLVLPVSGEDFWRSETSLRKEVFQGYDKTIRPSLNVFVLVRSLNVDGMDVKEDAHAVLLHGALQLMWEDPRLRWRLEEHNDVDRLGVDPQELWRPDFAMASSGGHIPTPPRSHVPALVYPDGKVIFVPPVDLPLTCLLDLTYWPYDMLNCSLRAGSWVHHGHMLNVTLADNALKFAHPSVSEGEAGGTSSSTNTRPEWEVIFANLTRHTQVVPCCSEPQVTLLVSVIVRRSAPAITWVMKTPVLCLCVMTCLVFLLPANGSEKVVFGGVCVLLNILFLGFAITIVYKDPIHTPLIVQLVTHQVVLTVVSVVVAVVVMRLARGPHSFPVPHVVTKLANTLATVLCLSSCSRRTANHEQEYAVIIKAEQIELGDRSGGEARQRDWTEDLGEWILLATVVDRLALVLYLAACAVTFIRFSPVLW